MVRRRVGQSLFPPRLIPPQHPKVLVGFAPTRPCGQRTRCTPNRQSDQFKKTDEVLARDYGALPLSYSAALTDCAGGTRTHDLRRMKHVLRAGSRSDSFEKSPTKGSRETSST